eukprot:3894528-Rhodomonas_salina.1
MGLPGAATQGRAARGVSGSLPPISLRQRYAMSGIDIPLLRALCDVRLCCYQAALAAARAKTKAAEVCPYGAATHCAEAVSAAVTAKSTLEAHKAALHAQ